MRRPAAGRLNLPCIQQFTTAEETVAGHIDQIKRDNKDVWDIGSEIKNVHVQVAGTCFVND
jgi:hypothetical protein